MVRKISIAVAAALLSSAAVAQGPMHDTWDINAPNGSPMALGQSLASGAAEPAAAMRPMHDTWDIDAPNGPASAAASAPATGQHTAVHGHAAAIRPDWVIEVGPETRYVNVTSGETVLFKAGSKSFAWTFEPTLDHPSFDLSQIAPADVAVPGVRIYCAPDEYERAS